MYCPYCGWDDDKHDDIFEDDRWDATCPSCHDVFNLRMLVTFYQNTLFAVSSIIENTEYVE